MKLHASKIPCSLEISKAELKIKLWMLVAKRLKGRKVNTQTILQKIKKANYTDNINVDLKYACRFIQESYANYMSIIKDGLKRINMCIHNLAVAKTKTRKIKLSNALKTMQTMKTRQLIGPVYINWRVQQESNYG